MSDNGHHNIKMKIRHYQGYFPNTTDEQARAAFVAKYGYEPQRVIRNEGAVLAGPIVEGEDDRDD